MKIKIEKSMNGTLNAELVKHKRKKKHVHSLPVDYAVQNVYEDDFQKTYFDIVRKMFTSKLLKLLQGDDNGNAIHESK